MAKKKAAGGLSFNMAEEIRKLLNEDRKLSGPDVYAALTRKFPNDKINESSCSVAFSKARRKLGIKGGTKRRKKAGAGTATRTVRRPTPAAVSRGQMDLAAIEQAQKFVTACGGITKARAVIDRLESLQLGKN